MVKVDDFLPRDSGFDSRESGKLFSVCSLDDVGLPFKQLGVEAFYYVVIIALMTCLTMKILKIV